ncbi:MAG: hypothetical protein AAGH68_07310 [Pseudomonadota bacterium]
MRRWVALLTLNLPDKHNALAPQMVAVLHKAAWPALDWTRARLLAMLDA